MKKGYLIAVGITILGSLLVKCLNPNQWDVVVYSLGAFFMLLVTGGELFAILRTRKGIYVEGVVKDVAVVEGSDEIKEIIEFISPTDHREYRIKNANTSIFDLQVRVDDRVSVWVNLKNPSKSLVAKKMDSIAFVSISGKLILVIFFIIMIVKNLLS